MPVIRVTPQLYRRLESHAQGFDTPTQVIERLLNTFEGTENINTHSSDVAESIGVVRKSKPELVFHPNEEAFRQSLILGGNASVSLHFMDGETEDRVWKTGRFNEDSKLRSNIWSGLLRGWDEKGIIKAEFHSDSPNA